MNDAIKHDVHQRAAAGESSRVIAAAIGFTAVQKLLRKLRVQATAQGEPATQDVQAVQGGQQSVQAAQDDQADQASPLQYEFELGYDNQDYPASPALYHDTQDAPASPARDPQEVPSGAAPISPGKYIGYPESAPTAGILVCILFARFGLGLSRQALAINRLWLLSASTLELFGARIGDCEWSCTRSRTILYVASTNKHYTIVLIYLW